MAIALAGRAAEIQEFGEASSGIAGDLATATEIAAQLVGTLGASDSLLSLQSASVAGADNLVVKVLHDPHTRAKADALMHGAAGRAACALLEHRRALLALAGSGADLADHATRAERRRGARHHRRRDGALTGHRLSAWRWPRRCWW